MKKEIVVDGKTYVLKERTYKIGDRFRATKGWCFAGDVYMLIEYGSDEVNFVKLEKQSGRGVGVGGTCSWKGFKVKDKYNITKKEIDERWDVLFTDFELIED